MANSSMCVETVIVWLSLLVVAGVRILALCVDYILQELLNIIASKMLAHNTNKIKWQKMENEIK